MMTISQQDFLRLAEFVKGKYGLNLLNKKHLIEGRLACMLVEKGISSFTSYVDRIIAGEQGEILQMMNKLTTNYTYFLREPAHYSLLRDTILPQLEQKKQDKSLNIWSAGCSTGEEPYTISMILKDYFGKQWDQWDTRILATDISQKALHVAEQAIYSEQAVGELPKGWAAAYFEKKENQYQVCQALRDNVTFRQFNLMEQIKFKVKFDVIFCRNVMIYFDNEDKENLVERFYQATNPGGWLLIGSSETIPRSSTNYQFLMPATFRKM